MDERDWARLVEQVGSGDCTPFLGAGACHGTLPTGTELSRIWADEYEYPFDDHRELPRVMQYAAISSRDSVYVKRRLVRQLAAMGQPDFTDPDEPHGLLARLPLPVYLTTNYDDFMTKALCGIGKTPLAAMCPWYEGADPDELFHTEQGLDPTADAPIVYHLHGRSSDPRSLVLTEEDYLEFLINLARDRSGDAMGLIPTPILTSLTTKPLLFIGYSLEDWTFRVLFHGMLRTVASVQRRRHVSVQLAPLGGNTDEARVRRATEYLTAYHDRWDISLYWGTAAAFCTELRTRIGW